MENNRRSLLPLPLSQAKNTRIGPVTDIGNQTQSAGVVTLSNTHYKAAYQNAGVDSALSGSKGPREICPTCNETARLCVGHNMVMQLPSYYNFNFLSLIQDYCNTYCTHCGRFMLCKFPILSNKMTVQAKAKELADMVRQANSQKIAQC